MSDSQRETSGVRVFRPLASESETLDWSRKERSRVRIGCRSACGNERCELGLADEFELLNESVDFQLNTVGR